MLFVAAEPNRRIAANRYDPGAFGTCNLRNALHETPGRTGTAQYWRRLDVQDDERCPLALVVGKDDFSTDLEFVAALLAIIRHKVSHQPGRRKDVALESSEVTSSTQEKSTIHLRRRRGHGFTWTNLPAGATITIL
jgi:hypothetical protein